MKKINFNGISEILNEKELKNVMGGSPSNNLCDSSYNRKSCTKQSDCGSGQMCITSGGTQKCCF